MCVKGRVEGEQEEVGGWVGVCMCVCVCVCVCVPSHMQPKMFSSCDALPYHWNPTSMAERVGLPPCNGSPTLNTLPHRFSVKPLSRL